MKKFFLFPILVLVFLASACGKKNNGAAVVTSSSQEVAPAATVSTTPTQPTTPVSNTVNLEQFCRDKYGQVLNGTCVVSQTYYDQYWLSFRWAELNSGIPIAQGQRVSISASGGPKVYVDRQYYRKGSGSFISSSDGYLWFQSFSSIYSVSQIQVTTCFSAPNQVTNCQ